MAYIEPKGKVWLCKDVPLNPSYEDTITWNSIDEQINYFIGKTKWSSEKYTPIKEKQGVLRFNGAVNKFYDCNYMMFENDNFYNSEYNWGEEKYNRLAPKKYFFAFITNVEYVNPETTLIHFQLDVMQTWFFEIKWERSLIEREHVEDDSLYANLEPENIQVNERIPFSKNFNLSTNLGERILITGFTENPYDIKTETGAGLFGTQSIPYTPYTQYPAVGKNTQPQVIQNYGVYNIGLTSGVNIASATYSQSAGMFYVDSTITSFTFYLWYELTIDNANSETVYEYHRYYITATLNDNIWTFNGYEIEEEPTFETISYSFTENYPNISGASILLNFNISDFNAPNQADGFNWKPTGDYSADIYTPTDFIDTVFYFTLTLDDWYYNNRTYRIKAEKIDEVWTFSEYVQPEGE